MSDTSSQASGASLGVGAIIGDSFSILFQNFIPVMILGFLPTLVGTLFSGVLLGWGVTLGTAEPQFDSAVQIVNFFASTLVQMAVYGISIALLVQMAYDAKLGRPLAIKRYFEPAIGAILPIVVLTIATTILMMIGLLALVIPGLWIYAVYSVTVPAIVIDRAGFGGMGRSQYLTKEYRWPVLGTIILIGICTVILSIVAVFIFTFIGGMLGGGVISVIISVVLVSALNGFAYGLSGISVALIYARLREIKEGVSVDQLADVFE